MAYHTRKVDKDFRAEWHSAKLDANLYCEMGILYYFSWCRNTSSSASVAIETNIESHVTPILRGERGAWYSYYFPDKTCCGSEKDICMCKS